MILREDDVNCAWVAVLDPCSGLRGRYTVHRIYRWAEKHTDIVGRELDLATARRLFGKKKKRRKSRCQ